MKIIKAIFVSLWMFASLNAIFAQSQSQNVTESMEKQTGSGKVASDVTKLPDAQLAMSVSYYPVTAGDVYTLAFAMGSTAVKYTIPVDSTYKIRVANMGVINCAGLTYLQLKSQVESLVLRNYPMGGVQFVLSSPSTFLVSITGEVNSTVERNAWALTRLSTFITSSFTAYSSNRVITIEGADGKTNTYDLFLAMRKGDLSQDPFLRPGDKIIINRAKRIVSINGAVERPGTYELLDGENLKTLIEFYGNGLAPLADTSRIELYRSLTGEKDAGHKSYLNEKSILDDFDLLCYDSIFISSYSELTPVVFLEGAVNIRGNKSDDLEKSLDSSQRIPVGFVAGEDYAFFARRNRGMFNAVSDLSAAYIIRGGEVIPLDLSPMLYDSSYNANMEIKANDRLVIPFKQYFISVAGAVAKPGRYPFIPDRTWEYYIGLAGGFDEDRNSGSAIVIRDINGKKLSKNDVITPECTITAKSNSFLYYFSKYATPITTTLSIVVSSLAIMTYTK